MYRAADRKTNINQTTPNTYDWKQDSNIRNCDKLEGRAKIQCIKYPLP